MTDNNQHGMLDWGNDDLNHYFGQIGDFISMTIWSPSAEIVDIIWDLFHCNLIPGALGSDIATFSFELTSKGQNSTSIFESDLLIIQGTKETVMANSKLLNNLPCAYILLINSNECVGSVETDVVCEIYSKKIDIKTSSGLQLNGPINLIPKMHMTGDTHKTPMFYETRHTVEESQHEHTASESAEWTMFGFTKDEIRIFENHLPMVEFKEAHQEESASKRKGFLLCRMAQNQWAGLSSFVSSFNQEKVIVCGDIVLREEDRIMLYTHGITTLLLADRGLNEIVSAVKGKCHDIVEFQEHTAWEKKYQYLLDMIPFRKFDLGETRQFVSYYKHVFSAMAIKAARDNRSLCLLTFPMPKVPQSINDKGLDMWLKEGFVGKMKGILRPIDIYFQYGNNIYIASHRMQELVGKIILKRFVHQLKPFVIENGKVVTVQTLRFFQENSVSVKDVSCIPSELVDMVSGFLEDKICLK